MLVAVAVHQAQLAVLAVQVVVVTVIAVPLVQQELLILGEEAEEVLAQAVVKAVLA